MSDSLITINPAKPSVLDFEVTIQGIDDATIPTVRFVIADMLDNCDYAFKCKKLEGEKHGWTVKLPSLPDVKVSNAHFRVEVIIDGYYFEPAEGEMTFVTASDVSFSKKKANRPSVTAAFVVKQDDEPAKVAESVSDSAGEKSDSVAPTNNNLQPEFDATIGQHKETEDEADPQSVDPTEIASSFTPGQGRRDADIEQAFDAKAVATEIVKRTVGNVQKPEKQGSLFKRGASGKTAIPGLEDRETKKTQSDRAAKVKEILGSTE